MSTVTLAFYAGISAEELEMLKGVSNYQFDTWTIEKQTENGKVSQSCLQLSSIDKRGESYSATLRVNLGGLLGKDLQRVNSQGMVENRHAYAQLNVSPGEEMYESFKSFYEAALEFPRNDNGSIYLEKGNGASLASLQIPTRGSFLITVLTDIVKSSAQVEDSGYYRVASYDVFGDVQFNTLTGTKRLSIIPFGKDQSLKAPNHQNPVNPQNLQASGFKKVGGGFNF